MIYSNKQIPTKTIPNNKNFLNIFFLMNLPISNEPNRLKFVNYERFKEINK